MRKKLKILIADPSPELCEAIQNAPGAHNYQLQIVHKGSEVFAKIDSFQPDLLLLELLLPEMHGIEVLKKLHSQKREKKMGIIVTSLHTMVQNYQTVIKEGADYFLEKPFDLNVLFTLFERFDAGALNPEPFSESGYSNEKEIYNPKRHSPHSYIKFWGTRGSNPVSGADYVRFGGNTCCLEVHDGEELVIIDAGTGIRELGEAMKCHAHKIIHLFLSHTHWDHITGFPFFKPLYQPDVQLCIWSPVGFEKPTKELFTEMLAYAYFPVRLDDIQAKIQFRDLRAGEPVSIGKILIDSDYAFHPGSTLCFKIHANDKIYGYATDNEMFSGFHGNPNSIGKDHPLIQANQRIIDFYKGCDLLIHEAQYTPQEYLKHVGWGHSSISNAAILAKYAEAHDWIVTHHDPKHTDKELLEKFQLHTEIMEECHIPCRVRMAFDGMTIPI